MKKKLLFIMDPIASINIKKDSTFAIMLAAQKAGHDIYYCEGENVFLRDGEVFATLCRIYVEDLTCVEQSECQVLKDVRTMDGKELKHRMCVPEKPNSSIAGNMQHHYQFLEKPHHTALKNIDIVFMRLDPPVTLNYIYITQLLDFAVKQGTKVINHPSSIRDCNEKLFAQWFAHCCPPTLVTHNMAQLKDFLNEQKRIIVKPLDGMGGRGIFYLEEHDKNKNAILESATHYGENFIMAQRFLPEISSGDKRITLINGEPLDYVVARIPASDEIRGNLVAGGTAKILPLTARDRWLCEQIAPTLKEKQLAWVGIDVIGDYITEINVTSPTCLREIETYTQTTIIDEIMQKLIDFK